jgi:hypothetical protein
MLTTHPHLVPRLSMSRSYTSSPPMCLHGVKRDSFTEKYNAVWKDVHKQTPWSGFICMRFEVLTVTSIIMAVF